MLSLLNCGFGGGALDLICPHGLKGLVGGGGRPSVCQQYLATQLFRDSGVWRSLRSVVALVPPDLRPNQGAQDVPPHFSQRLVFP